MSKQAEARKRGAREQLVSATRGFMSRRDISAEPNFINAHENASKTSE